MAVFLHKPRAFFQYGQAVTILAGGAKVYPAGITVFVAGDDLQRQPLLAVILIQPGGALAQVPALCNVIGIF